jgi:hypothetical protein
MLDPQPVIEPPLLVHHKCHQCGFDLHGRQYGERCPECGTIIERLAPPWWNSESLARIARAAARAKWASLTLMLLPILGLLMAVTGMGRFFSGRGYVLIACAMLLLQVGVQAAAVETVARQPIGDARRRWLRGATVLRLCVFAAILAAVMVEVVVQVIVPDWIAITLYFSAPTAVVATDVVAMWVFRSLAREMRWRDTAWHEGATAIARGMLVFAGLLVIMPWCGWIFAPMIWAASLAQGFRALERFAKAGVAAQ